MGGRALGVETCRLDAEVYFKLYEQIKVIFPEVELIPSYRTKTTFGDMDLLYRKGDLNPQSIETILNEFTPIQGTNRNGDVTSIGVLVEENGLFQLDFIGVPADTYDFALKYFSFNDLGNLIGRVASRLSLKFGHKGLFYVQREGDLVLKEHLLTDNFYRALEYLDLSYYWYHNGFDTLEDMFQWVMGSEYYDFSDFDLENRNHKSRIRDEKRPNYRAFLKYAADNPIVNALILPREYYLNMHFDHFPDFKVAYEESAYLYQQNKIYKKIVNGNVCMEITGLKGPELGRFMQIVNQYLDKETAIEMGSDRVKNMITGIWVANKHGFDYDYHR